MKSNFLRLSAVLAIAIAFVQQSFAAEFLVKYRNKAGAQQLMNLAMTARAEVAVLDVHAKGSYTLVDLAEKSKIQTIMQLIANPNIEYVVPNFKLYAVTAPMEFSSMKKEQWSMVKIQAEKAWGRADNKGRKNIVIAVIDTGVDYKHKNLAPNMVAGYDFRNNDNDPMDETSDKNPGHGTHCAGIAAASNLIDDGIVGMGAEVSIMPLRFLGADGSGDLNAAIKAIDYAIEKGVHVISASWGATVPRSQATPLIEAIQRADDKGVIFVAAAANDGRSNDTTDVFPANAGTPNMISVAASDVKDEKPSWSNFGKATVDLASPGLKIMSTLPKDNYGELSGTSMATPLVSGLVAFLKAQDSSLTGAQIRSLLQTTGAKVNIETACNCRIDAFGAVDALLNKKAWLVPAARTLEVNGTTKISMVNGEAPFKFTSSQPTIVKVDEQGNVTGVAEGTANITVVDSKGTSLTSLDYNVGKAKGSTGDCIFGDPAMCDMICGIMPDLPFCSGK